MNEDASRNAHAPSNAGETELPTNETEISSALTWQWSVFDELSPHDLYEILRLRQLVFVVEQSCPYLDADGHDAKAWHLLGHLARRGDDEATPLLAAYVRIFSPGIKYAEASIGRVVTHPQVRRTGVGKILMSEAIRRVESLAPHADIRIGAQMYLEKFYELFGFHRVSKPYDEDGIPHIEMIRKSRQ